MTLLLGREDISVVDRLLDPAHTPRKPQFEMAPDEPLLLWGSGKTVQVDPIKPTFKAPGTKRLKLK